MPNHFHFLIVPKSGYVEDCFKKDLATSLRSYTRAINKQENRSGSLFRSGTKFKNGLVEKFVTVDDKKQFFGGDGNYAQQCFEYIHQNPVKAKLVTTADQWKYSSSRDYQEKGIDSICNLELGKELNELN